MSVEPVILNKSSYPTTDKKGYRTSRVGSSVGFTTGVSAGGLLAYNKIKPLNTVSGKANMLVYLHNENLALSESLPRVVLRDSMGKIIPPLDGLSQKSKILVKNYKNKIYGLGTTIAVIATGLGVLADKAITKVNKKEALGKKLNKITNFS